MSDFFDKNELNEKNSIPKTEDKDYVHTESDKRDFQDKEEIEKAEKAVLFEKEEQGEKGETPSDASEIRKADNEGKSTEKEAQNPDEKVWQINNTDTPKRKKRGGKNIGLVVAVVAIAMIVTVFCGFIVKLAADTAMLVSEAFDGAFDFYLSTGDTAPNDEESDGRSTENNGPVQGALEMDNLEVDTSVSVNDLSVAQVVSKTKNTVALITVMGYDRYGRQTASTGSGVVITEDGYIVTNNHVVEGAVRIYVTLPNKGEFEAKLVGLDPTADVGLIKINTTGLSYATLGDSDALVMGQEVVALGYPLGSAQTVTAGLVSALDVKAKVEGYTMSLIRTNAAINPGNSGGGLFDRSGRLIGIVNAKQVDTDIEGLGYAIPINTVVESLDKINNAVS